VAIDRGFAGLKFIQELVQENKYFVLRIKNNWKLEFQNSTGLVKVGTSDDAQAYRVINFCDLDTKTKFRLVTNLPASGDAAVSDDEIRDIYRLRWGVHYTNLHQFNCIFDFTAFIYTQTMGRYSIR